MPSFKPIDDVKNINLPSGWKDAVKFTSKGKIVGEDGKAVKSDYRGRKYQLVSKKEREFTCLERLGRGFLATIAVVISLGIALLFKCIRDLYTIDREKIRYGVAVKPLNAKEELQKGVNISQETIEKIQNCMANILSRKEEGGVKLYTAQHNHRVFSMDTAPDYIFKMKASKTVITLGRDDSMKARYEAMIKAKAVCTTHQLGLLVIPNAKLFTVNANGEEYEIIAEKRLDFNPSESIQEENFDTHASSLNEAIRQLAVFICKTGYSDVEWRNNPMLNDQPNELGQRKIALIDIEEMGDVSTGLFGGGLGRRGLVGCVNEDQAEIVEKVAKENRVPTNRFAKESKRRKLELEENRKLKAFYKAKKLVTGKEPIQVDLQTLGLDLKEEYKHFERFKDENGEIGFRKRVITLEEAAATVIQAINQGIQKKSDDNSTKEKRRVLLNTNHGLVASYHDLGDVNKENWLKRIIDALVKKQHLFKLVQANGHGYFIQA